MTVYLLFVVYLVLYMYTSKITDSVADEYYSGRQLRGRTTPKVYDILHRTLPEWHSYNTFHDIVTMAFVLPLLAYPEILPYYIKLWLIVFLVRSITVNLTILPKYKECTPSQWNVMRRCYDKIFSGHFATVFLAAALYVQYGIINVTTACMMVLTVSFGAIVTRDHYTIDLVVSLMVCTIVLQNVTK